MRFLSTCTTPLRCVMGAAMIGAWGMAPGPLRAEPAGALRIEGGLLADALRRVGREARVTVLFSPALVAGRHVAPVTLKGDAAAMLRHLLAGTGLRLRVVGAHAMLIEAAPPRPLPRPEPPLPPPALMAPGDIMVTAMRRPTRLADTPVSMIAVTGSELERSGATGMQALAALAPSLTWTAMGTGMNRLSLRGVYAAGEPTVGVYYGSVPVAGPGGSTSDPGLMTPDLMLVDIDRVEVLRGPQGTLFGTNSLAGTVRILFRTPDMARREAVVSASATATRGGGPGGSLAGTLNLPLVGDRLALRAVAYGERKGGVLDNPATGARHVDGQTRKGGRMALRWQAARQWRVDLSGAYQQGRIDDAANAAVGAGIDQTRAQARVPFTDRLWLANGEVNGSLGALQLSLSLSHFDWAPRRRLDFSASENSHRGDKAACAAWFHSACSDGEMASFARYVDSQTPSMLDQPFTVRVDSGEARLSGSGPVTWTGGVFVSHRRDTGASTALPVDASSGLVAPGTTPTATRDFESSLKEFALFGDGSWHLRRWLTLSAGGRYFDYVRQAQGLVRIPNPITGPFVTSSFQESYHADGAVGRARIELRPDKRLLVFGQVSSGFRPGGINVVPGLDPSLAAYRDDRLTSWEGGGRIRLKGDRLRFDFAAYRQNWARMQYAATTTDGSYSFITNIGSARIKGGELSLGWEPGRHLLARIEATFTDARLASDQINAIAITPGQKGDRLPYVAPVALGFELVADRRVGRDLTLRGSIDAHFTGRAYDSFRGTSDGPRQAMGNNGTLDASIGLRRGGSQVDLSVHNLTDGRAIVWIGRGLSTDTLQRARPRSITLSLRRSF